MEPYPNRKRFRRRTKLENAAAQLERMNNLVMGSVQMFGAYADPQNWRLTGETRDVKNDAGLVVGVEQEKAWVGPGDGPGLATHALKQILGVKAPAGEPNAVEGEKQNQVV